MVQIPNLTLVYARPYECLNFMSYFLLTLSVNIAISLFFLFLFFSLFEFISLSILIDFIILFTTHYKRDSTFFLLVTDFLLVKKGKKNDGFWPSCTLIDDSYQLSLKPFSRNFRWQIIHIYKKFIMHIWQMFIIILSMHDYYLSYKFKKLFKLILNYLN